METSYGLLALLPPIIAIVFCFITKRVMVSLFLGVFSGGLIISGFNPFGGIEYSLNTIVASITDEWNTQLLLFNLLMGSGVAFIWRLGGSKALTDWARPKVKTRRQAATGGWFLGMLVFFNDYINAAIVGNVFRNIYEDLKISKEKLSYILDSTAAPVATFFISDWIAFQIGMVQSGIDSAGIEGMSAFTGYIMGIPFNFYCILAVIMVGIIAYTGKDFGPMLKAEHRAYTTGETARKDSSKMLDVEEELGEAKETKPRLLTFFLPIAALVVVALAGFWITGKEGGSSIIDILGSADPAKALLWGAFAMAAAGALIALGTRLMTLKETMDTFIDGMKLMLLACAILVLAWSLGGVTKEMQLAEVVISIIGSSVPFFVIPLIIFGMGMFIAFSTGTSWGAMAIITPVAISLTYSITADPYLSVIMAGVVFSGAIFGDHCSPISDTTVLASIFSGSDHMDHVSTQIPYALTAAGVAALMYLAFGFFEITPAFLIPAGVVILFMLIYVLNKAAGDKYKFDHNVEPS